MKCNEEVDKMSLIWNEALKGLIVREWQWNKREFNMHEDIAFEVQVED